jgi:hypothetical protein
MHTFEHRARPYEPLPRQQRRANAGLRRPAGMQPLGPGALGEIFDDAARHAAGDAECVDDLLRIEAERRANAGRRPHRAKNRGGVKAGLVHRLRHHHAQPAQHLAADRDADQRHAAVGIMFFARGQYCGHQHGAGMHRAALERVVEILAMRRGSVDEGSTRGGQRARVADRRAGAVIVTTCERAFDVVLIARGDTQPGHVDQQVLAFARRLGGQATGLQRGDLEAKRFGDGNFWQFGCHDGCRSIRCGRFLYSAS